MREMLVPGLGCAARTLLRVMLGVGVLVMLLPCGMNETLAASIAARCFSTAAPSTDANSTSSLMSFPLGLNGSITSNSFQGRLADNGEALTFIGTSSGLYALSADGAVRCYLPLPFGVTQIRLLDDTTGDGIREILVLLDGAPVPVLRCYDGAGRSRIWQSDEGEIIFMQNAGWASIQPPILQLELLHAGQSEAVATCSSRCLKCTDTRTGVEIWRYEGEYQLGRFAVIGDRNGDGVDDLCVASHDGSLRMIDGQTGKAGWEKGLPQSEFELPGGEMARLQPRVNDIALFGADHVVISSTDGKVRVLDLQSREWGWSAAVGDYDDRLENLRISLTPDTTADGLPEVLVAKCGTPSGSLLSLGMPQTGVTLVDSSGGQVWEQDMNVCWSTGIQVGICDGRSAILEPDAFEVRIRDLQSGEVIRAFQRPASLGEAAQFVSLNSDAYFLASDLGDAVVMSGTGRVLWSYPRIGQIQVESAGLRGSEGDNVLFICSTAQGDSTRILSLLDLLAKREVWSYVVPASDMATKGGLTGIQVAEDLVLDDGIRDIVGWRGGDVFVFSGADGSMSQVSVAGEVTWLSTIKNGTGTALVVGTAGGLSIMGRDGTTLWNASSTLSVDDPVTRSAVVGDINHDDVSDLAFLTAADRLEVLVSDEGRCSYHIGQVFQPRAGHSLELIGSTVDIDGDGVREIAYFERCDTSNPVGYAPPVLFLRSPVDGRTLLESQQGWRPFWDLACGDFNGDGCLDSVLCQSPADLPADTKNTAAASADRPVLQVISGKDGGIVWTHVLSTPNPSVTISQVPAMGIGDLNGDGADDLLFTAETWEGSHLRSEILVYDVVHDAGLLEFPVDPIPSINLERTPLVTELLLNLGDLDGDSSAEIAIGIDEEVLIPGRGARNFASLAVFDPREQVASSYLLGIDPWHSSIFMKGPGLLGVAAYGAACFVDLNSNLRLTSPVSGSTTSSPLRMEWEQNSPGDYVEIFADGVRQGWSTTGSFTLSLTPGEHRLVIRSYDDFGRICHSEAYVQTQDSLWQRSVPILLLFVCGGLLFLVVYPRLSLIIDRRKARRAAAQLGLTEGDS